MIILHIDILMRRAELKQKVGEETEDTSQERRKFVSHENGNFILNDE